MLTNIQKEYIHAFEEIEKWCMSNHLTECKTDVTVNFPYEVYSWSKLVVNEEGLSIVVGSHGWGADYRCTPRSFYICSAVSGNKWPVEKADSNPFVISACLRSVETLVRKWETYFKPALQQECKHYAALKNFKP